MIKKKLDHADGGLQGSWLRYLCTFCHTTRETAKTHIGTFCIDTSFQEIAYMGRYVEVNPDKLSSSALAEKAKSVQLKPVLSDPKMKLVNATHADINLSQFFKKLIIREIAGAQVWDASNDVEEYIENTEKRLNDHVRATIGLAEAPIFKMPGNYARTLFDASNKSTFLEVIPNQDKKGVLFSQFSEISSF
ncbi:V(D)J recombination-activating protein 1-like [Lytechinus variegatus]|uniref:V(D)J recombination-activating protein 1-like n=1 Tax=Lytechinus variegatus TaxID=7654 RepID=UPI001BB236CA|nr:V(D)J recombination-activating protein 1-like [Lytechinus variegatus]